MGSWAVEGVRRADTEGASMPMKTAAMVPKTNRKLSKPRPAKATE